MDVKPYAAWSKCLHLSNGKVDVAATLEVGPRIIRCGWNGERNLFKEFDGQPTESGTDEWRCYGGHRLWHAPESMERTYVPDNGPVEWRESQGMASLVQPVEKKTGIQKQIDIWLHPTRPQVRVVHRLRNLGVWDVEVAPWALSVMAEEGRAIVPQEPYAPHPKALLPARPLVVWPYTNMTDKRISFGRHFVQLRQIPNMIGDPVKLGMRNTAGWCAYSLDGTVFLKRSRFLPSAVYPDFGCNTEVFTDSEMLELESLGPLQRLAAGGGEVAHEEHWFLFWAHLPAAEEELERALQPLLDRSRAWFEELCPPAAPTA